MTSSSGTKFNPHAGGISNLLIMQPLNLNFDWFQCFLQTTFIIWILLKNINDDFRNFSRKFVIEIFVKMIMNICHLKGTFEYFRVHFYDDVIFRNDSYFWDKK